MWLLQAYYPELGIGTIMGVAMASGLSTSMLLETALLRLGRDGLSWSAAAKTAAGMSFISMLTMEAAQNAVDYHLTGGTVAFDSPAFWAAAVISMSAGFLAPLPYNYLRLKKYDDRDVLESVHAGVAQQDSAYILMWRAWKLGTYLHTRRLGEVENHLRPNSEADGGR
ncbi:uncharacterized protein JN550_000590 [Neoarthrinium moseri]|uniref:uncharacterized protein n=1 Tax=Neoarthrinium moseri TaxID=1658444 RepID=UPI001FDC9E0C|nr:uncharacterized protein JN550_000590 [Neoarthrinium moseri]KAI1878408.1 hypothetical protein JN550_000590 [Neoarthrinium moseri]